MKVIIITIILFFFLNLTFSIFDLDYKVIFTHPQKCGGTSVELSFLDEKIFFNMSHPWRQWKHATLSKQINEIKRLGYNPDEFYKFSITRNPWDRVVSWYNFKRRAQSQKYVSIVYNLSKKLQHMQRNFYDNLTFKRFVMEPGLNQYVLGAYEKLTITTDEHFFFYKNQFALDYVIRLEHFEEDIKIVFKAINKKDYILTKYSQHKDDLKKQQLNISNLM